MKRFVTSAIALVAVFLFPTILMAQVKISDLPAAGALTGTEIVPVVQGGDTEQTTTAAIAALAPSGTSGDWTASATCTPIASVSCTTTSAQYIRVGNIVMWAVTITANTTGSTVATLDVALPVASAFAATTNASGACGSDTTSTSAGHAEANATDDRLRIVLRQGSDIAARTIGCSGSYRVL